MSAKVPLQLTHLNAWELPCEILSKKHLWSNDRNLYSFATILIYITPSRLTARYMRSAIVWFSLACLNSCSISMVNHTQISIIVYRFMNCGGIYSQFSTKYGFLFQSYFSRMINGHRILSLLQVGNRSPCCSDSVLNPLIINRNKLGSTMQRFCDILHKTIHLTNAKQHCRSTVDCSCLTYSIRA